MIHQTHIVAVAVCLIAGCSRPASEPQGESLSAVEAVAQQHAPVATGAFGDEWIVNAFGMKFVRIEVDPERSVGAHVTAPQETYYLQQTEVTGEHLVGLRKFARENGIRSDDLQNIAMSEWRDISKLADLMSECDPKYDYGLPSRSQWIFACMSGYEQRCDEGQPNAFGIVDMLDGDVEVIDELGILMGRWINNWGEHTGQPKPNCPCEHWTRCNPDADDSLNEIIVGRFVLLPEGAAAKREGVAEGSLR